MKLAAYDQFKQEAGTHLTAIDDKFKALDDAKAKAEAEAKKQAVLPTTKEAFYDGEAEAG